VAEAWPEVWFRIRRACGRQQSGGDGAIPPKTPETQGNAPPAVILVWAAGRTDAGGARASAVDWSTA